MGEVLEKTSSLEQKGICGNVGAFLLPDLTGKVVILWD